MEGSCRCAGRPAVDGGWDEFYWRCGTLILQWPLVKIQGILDCVTLGAQMLKRRCCSVGWGVSYNGYLLVEKTPKKRLNSVPAWPELLKLWDATFYRPGPGAGLSATPSWWTRSSWMCMASICFWYSWLPELMKSSQFEVRELKLEALASDVLLLVSSFHYLVHAYFVECILPFCHVFN